MVDPKIRKKIDALQRLIDHPSTGDGERAAAKNRLAALKAKHNVTDPPKRNFGTQPPRDRTNGFNSTSKPMWDYIQEQFVKHGQQTTPQQDAERIRRQQQQYESWKKANERIIKKMAEDRAREARQREAREAAQKAWEEKNRNRDARGVPLTEEERRMAQNDPLGWAAKQDGRTRQQRNDDLQHQYTHGWNKATCAEPLTFYDQGGEMRSRNTSAENCGKCGTRLYPGEGSMENGLWVCTETVPGPRKKKPGRG